jgi:hypothetical protein
MPAHARLWAAKSVIEGHLEPVDGRAPFPLTLVASGASAGAKVGAALAPLPARPLWGAAGLPALRVPLLLDATFLERGPTKAWAACARGCASAGAALQVSPAQFAERKEVLRAAGIPLVLAVAPGEPMTPEACSAAALVVIALCAPSGTPAVLSEDAIVGLAEAARAASQYKVPVAVMAPPGRTPSVTASRQLAEVGAAGLGIGGGPPPSRLPLAALLGIAGAILGLERAPAPYILSDEVTDGVQLACAMAASSGALSMSLPLRLAAAEEVAMDADWKAVGDQLGQAVRVLWQDAQRAAAAVGVRDPRDLTRENVRALTYEAAALSGLRLAGFEDRLPWWTH